MKERREKIDLPMVIICNTMSIKKSCIIMSDKWGPIQTIEQCLDRIEHMQTDSLHESCRIRIRKLSVRTKRANLWNREYPNSSSGA